MLNSETTPEEATTTAPAEEFQNIPLDLIIVEKQIRTDVNVNGEDFQGFFDSVADKGVIEPVVVTPQEDKFRMLAGELRYRASLKLGLATIPARILRNVQTAEEVLTIQLIENLQRREINPIDKANAILAFFKKRHGEMAVTTICNALLNYDRDPGRVKNEITTTVAVIMKYVGMKTRSIENILLLLTLPSKIRDAVKTGAVPVSQGYILAANLENPGLMTVFEAILAEPVTNKRLTELLKNAAAGETLTSRLLYGKVRYDIDEMEKLHLYFLSVIEVIEKAKAGGGTAKQTANLLLRAAY